MSVCLFETHLLRKCWTELAESLHRNRGQSRTRRLAFWWPSPQGCRCKCKLIVTLVNKSFQRCPSACVERLVFNPALNCLRLMDDERRCGGSAFQTVGAAAWKLRRPSCVFFRGDKHVVAFYRMKICPTSNAGDETQTLLKYAGQCSRTQSNAEIAIPNCIRCGTGSQQSTHMSRKYGSLKVHSHFARCNYCPTTLLLDRYRQGTGVCHCLLDMTAAFDTVDHYR